MSERPKPSPAPACASGYAFAHGSGYALPEYPFVEPPEIRCAAVVRHPVVIVGAGITGLTLACALARQGVGMIAGMNVETRTDPRGMNYHWLTFRRGDRAQGPESDYSALRAGKVVVTPLRYDRTDDEAYADLAGKLPRFVD